MAKYRAKSDMPPYIKAGNVVEFKEPLVDGMKGHFEAVDDDTPVTGIHVENPVGFFNPLADPTAAGTQLNDGGLTPGGDKQSLEDEDADEDLDPDEDADEDDDDKKEIVNPSRDELKARATALGINFASNIPTERLMELVKEAEDKKAAEEPENGATGNED